MGAVDAEDKNVMVEAAGEAALVKASWPCFSTCSTCLAYYPVLCSGNYVDLLFEFHHL